MLHKVEDIFLHIKPLLPIPAKITLPLHLEMTSRAFKKDLSKDFFNFFKPLISVLITSFAISLKLLFLPILRVFSLIYAFLSYFCLKIPFLHIFMTCIFWRRQHCISIQTYQTG